MAFSIPHPGRACRSPPLHRPLHRCPPPRPSPPALPPPPPAAPPLFCCELELIVVCFVLLCVVMRVATEATREGRDTQGSERRRRVRDSWSRRRTLGGGGGGAGCTRSCIDGTGNEEGSLDVHTPPHHARHVCSGNRASTQGKHTGLRGRHKRRMSADVQPIVGKCVHTDAMCPRTHLCPKSRHHSATITN
jgi:hypothetical protein